LGAFALRELFAALVRLLAVRFFTRVVFFMAAIPVGPARPCCRDSRK
jgi:hypothetical protein